MMSLESQAPAPRARLVVITGLQRSGSTALGEYLGTQEGLVYLGEIFHPVSVEDIDRAPSLRLRPEASFFKFFNERAPERLRRGAPTRSKQSELWSEYLADLFARFGTATLVVDVKCNSWRCLDDCWAMMSGPPLLLELVALDDVVQVVHLVRRDEIARLASLFVSGTNGTYHAIAGIVPQFSTDEIQAREIDVEWAKLYLKQCRAETGMLDTWLSPAKCLKTFYEDVFESDGFVSEAMMHALSSFLGRPLHQSPPVLQKLAADPTLWIKNWPAVAEALAALCGSPERASQGTT